MTRCGRGALVVIAASGMLLLLAGPAAADDCRNLTDCFNTIRSAVAAATALAVLLGTVVSMGLNFVPIVGGAKGLYEAWTGEDMITGEKLGDWERGLGFAALALGPAWALARAARGFRAAARAAARGATRTAPGLTRGTRLATPRQPVRLTPPVRTPRMPEASAGRGIADEATVPRLDKGAPEGLAIPRHRLPEVGIPPENFDAIQDIARKYDVDIYVRPTNPEAVRKLREGAHPKPLPIKNKTVNEDDLSLNGHLTRDDSGKAAYFDPMPPGPYKPPDMPDAQWAGIQKRFRQRYAEYVDQAEGVRKYGNERAVLDSNGVAVRKEPPLYRVERNGVMTHARDGKPFTGDHDVFEIRSSDPRRVLTYEQRAEVAEALQRRTPSVQHPAHMDWVYDPADQVSRGIDQTIRNSHLPGKEILVRVPPNGPPMTAYYHP